MGRSLGTRKLQHKPLKTKLHFDLMETSLQTTGDAPRTKRVFIPQETLDHPFDVTLVVEDGKCKFKAHRRVLSEASPFFEKLLSSGMRESIEGVVRLEMLAELCLREILEFIYTGSVQISAEDNAQELIAMADYLVLPHLKTMAATVLVQKLNSSNAVSTYYFAERYRCEELISATTNFILANFTTVAKTEEFLNLPSKEFKMLLSSDEIVVGSEEDLFKAILSWIDRDKGERKKYFAELFREVRLVYVSRDYIHSDIVTNDLVNENEGCLDLVKRAVKLIDSKNSDQLTVKPRKSLETPVLVICMSYEPNQIICYNVRENTWSRLRGTIPQYTEEVLSCRGKLYILSTSDRRIVCYDPFINCWTSLPFEEQWGIYYSFVRNEDEIYVLVYADESPVNDFLRSQGRHSPCGSRHLSFLTKYKPESNSWEDITSFDLGSRIGICVVAKDDFIYFLGGYNKESRTTLKDADRFDLSTNTWDKIADLQEQRGCAGGHAAHGKIFVVGGASEGGPYEMDESSMFTSLTSQTCEVYHETTNEWHFIANFKIDRGPHWCRTEVCADGKLFVLSSYVHFNRKFRETRVIECYDADKGEWKEETVIPLRLMPSVDWWNEYKLYCCSMRVFKGCNFLQKADKRKCAIM